MISLSPFSLILLCLAILSLITEYSLGSSLVKTITTPLVMLIMMIASELVRYFQERHSRRVYEKIVSLTHHEEEAKVGEKLTLEAGGSVAGDTKLEISDKLIVSESMITGESGAIEKRPGDVVYAKSRILSGRGVGVVIATGGDSAYGRLLPRKISKSAAFDSRAGSIALVLVKFMVVLVPVVFLASSVISGNLMTAFLFALSVAIGLTPEMLPLVINACLVKGSYQLGRKKTIVRNLRAMQDLGSIDILAIDKTGTLTGDKLVLEYYLDILGRESARTLALAYLASSASSNQDDPFDAAILKAKEMPRFEAIMEEAKGLRSGIVKGRVEEILPLCKYAELKDELVPIEEKSEARVIVDELTEDGMRVEAIAYLKGSEYVLVGYLAFFDAPKKSAKSAIEKLKSINVGVKVLTGDNRLTASSVCKRLGIEVATLLTGNDLDKLSDDELQLSVESTQVFAELTPRQKARLMSALKENGHKLGFVGDGFNDLSAMLSSHVAISVDSASKEAKNISDIILLEKDLNILEEAILEGRKAFHNMSKYVRITAASNFGNICSIVIASVCLPFFPMTSLQLLALNLLYDGLCFALPWDNVDSELSSRPLEWSSHSLARFMLHFGFVSTLFDLAMFGFLFFVFCPMITGGSFVSLEAGDKGSFIALFQSGWFLVSLWSQVLILHLLRTPKISFVKSIASRPVLIATCLGLIAFSLLPMTKLGSSLGLIVLPWYFAAFLALDVLVYMALTSIVKARYLKKFGSLA